MKETSAHLAAMLRPAIAAGVGPAYLRLAAGLRALIVDGRLITGTRLPSERQLADGLGLSRTTVTAAYDALRADGFAASRQGSGTLTRRPTGGSHGHPAMWAPAVALDDDIAPDAIDLAQAAIQPNPPAITSAYQAALDVLPEYLGGHGYTLSGLAVLRQAVADRFTRRGLPTDADQIMITNGAQQAITIVTQHLVSPGDRVVVDHPTYPGAIDALRQLGARLVPVPLGDAGRDLDAFRSTVAQTAPRLAYLVVDFQNPTGFRADDDERAALAASLTAARVTPLIDETLVEVVLDDGEPRTPFAVLAPSAVTVGGASKPYWGGIRIGWIRADRDLIDRFTTSRAAIDYASPVLEQLVVAHLLADDGGVLADLQESLRSRRAALLDAVAEHLPSWQVTPPPGGLSLWYDIGAPMSTRLVHAVAGRGVMAAVGPRFGVDGSFENRLRLPYCLPEDRLREGVARIAGVWAGLDRRGRVSVSSPGIVV